MSYIEWRCFDIVLLQMPARGIDNHDVRLDAEFPLAFSTTKMSISACEQNICLPYKRINTQEEVKHASYV